MSNTQGFSRRQFVSSAISVAAISCLPNGRNGFAGFAALDREAGGFAEQSQVALTTTPPWRDQGILNLGTLSNVAQEDHNGTQIHPQKDSFVVVTRLGMRVDLPDSGRAGTATVSAYLLSSDPLRTVSLDGIRLSMTPEIIARHVSYGAITEHVLKVMVPASMPPGLLMDLIGVNVASN